MFGKEFMKSVFEESQNILHKILTVDKKVLGLLESGITVSVFPDGTLVYDEEKEVKGYNKEKEKIGRVNINTFHLYLSEDLPYMIEGIDIKTDADFGDLLVGSCRNKGSIILSDFFVKDERFLRDYWKKSNCKINIDTLVSELSSLEGECLVLYEDKGSFIVSGNDVLIEVPEKCLKSLLESLPNKPISKIYFIVGRNSGKTYIRKSSVKGEYDILLR